MAKEQNDNLSIGFHRSADRFPERTALEVGDQSYTYAEMSAQVKKTGKAINESKAVAKDLVAILAYRSFPAYVSLLAVLSTGRGYVPLHPDMPVERTKHVLDSSGTDLVIVSEECREPFERLLEKIDRKLMFVLVGFEEKDQLQENYPQHQFLLYQNLEDAGEEFAVGAVDKNDVAYLLFTSGSTGVPKGVPVSHGNVRSYVEFITGKYNYNEFDRCSQMHDMTFDFSVHDMYLPWETGACLCVVAKEEKLFPLSFIKKKKLTIWASVPSIGAIIDKYGRLESDIFPNLRYSFFCGEALSANVADKWQKAACNSQIVNLYGPTEATMAIAYYEWDEKTSKAQCTNGIVPIGRVFETQLGRVAREDGTECSPKEEGELCLSGSQVTKGYWQNSEKTRQQYVTFGDTGDELWYKTGDLVQKAKDGCLYYIGRIDNQVQILGNRVELGEIDKVLREISGNEMAVAVPWPVENGVASGIVAFVTEEKQLDKKEILAHCKKRLPVYMVPTRVKFIEEIPLNNNGKTDIPRLRFLLESEQ